MKENKGDLRVDGSSSLISLRNITDQTFLHEIQENNLLYKNNDLNKQEQNYNSIKNMFTQNRSKTI